LAEADVEKRAPCQGNLAQQEGEIPTSLRDPLRGERMRGKVTPVLTEVEGNGPGRRHAEKDNGPEKAKATPQLLRRPRL
jgi:hypothetical protein